jgi:hypothetical protein
MRVTMKAGIAGTRNGEDWPAPGGSIDLPQDEAELLVANGLAVLDESTHANKAAVETAAAEAPENAAAPKARARKAAAPKA